MNLRQIQDIAGHRNLPPWVIKLVQDCIEYNKYDGIHSCHPDCQRPVCVSIRKRIKAAVLAEREQCAKVCEENASEWIDGDNDWCRGQVTGSNDCAEAIRARSE